MRGFDAASSTDLYKRNDFHYKGNHEARRTDAGTTPMGLTAADFENVNPNFTGVVFSIIDGYQTITPIEETVTVTVTGKNSALPYDGSTHSVTGYTYEADHSLYRRSDWEFSGTSRASQKDAGTAQMGMKPEQFTNLNENFTRVVFIVNDGFQTITPIEEPVTVTITGKNNTRAYDGNAHSVSGYSFEADNRLYKQTDFRFSGTAEASRTDAGTSQMGLAPEQFSNESTNFTNVVFAVTDGFQTITPLTGVTVTITGNNSTLPYDRTEHRVEGYKTSFSSKLYTEDDFSFSGTAAAARTDAGTTEMGLKAEQFENTSGNFSDVTFTVRDGYQTITPVPAVTVTITGNTDSVPFDGSEHSVSGYTFSADNDLYKEADFSFSGSATAKQTDAGTAYMGLTAAHFSNENQNFTTVKFNVTDGSITVTKLPAVTVTITGHTDTAEYDGAEHSVSGYDVSIDTDLYKEADFSFSGTAEAKRTDAGTTEMGLTPAQFTNTNPNFETVTFKVTDGFLTVTPISGVNITITGHTDTAEYDGTEHSVSGYDVSVDHSLYEEADFVFSGTAEAKQTDAGTASMGLAPEQFRSTNPNFEDVTFAVTDGSVTVTKVPEVNVSITGHTDTAEYDGTEHSVSGYDVSIDNDLYKKADISFSGTAEAKQTDAGTASMGLAPEQFTNLSPNFETVNFTVTDGFLTVTPLSGVTVTITGHNSTVEYDGTEHSVSGYDVSINKDLYKESDFSFSGTAEAKQTDAGTALMGLVPEQFTNQNPNAASVSFAVTDGFITVTKVPEVNVTITGHSLSAEYDGTEHIVSGYDVSINHSVYQEADFSFSGSAEASQTEAGTASMGLNAGQFTNENGSFETVNFIITDGSVTVAPRTAALKWAPTEFIYDGDPHLPAASVTNLVDGDSCAVTVTGEQSEAGSHTAEALSLDNSNYILPADPTVTFTIGKKTAEIRWENTEFTYDGDPHVPTAVVSNLQEGQECTVSVEGAQVNANAEGEPYTAVVTGLSNDNYVLPEEPLTTTFIIKKAPIIEGSEFTAPRAVPGLTFDGESHPLILPGSWTGEAEGTFLYRLAGYAPKAPDAEGFSEALPEGTDSGIYTVEWMIRGDGNHLDLGPESLSASIDQKTIEPQMIEISPAGFAFDGETHSVTFTLRDGERELTEGTDYVVESAALSGSEPGLYAIRVRGTGNYTGSVENTWVIGLMEIRGADSVTTGSSAAQELFMDPELQGAVITWSVDNPAQLSLNAISGQETLVTGIRAGGAFLTAAITTPEGTYTLRKEIRVDYEMFETTPGLNRLWDPERDLPSFADHANLPATGFPVNSGMPKAVRERAVPYTDLKMRIQIPSIDVDAELAGVPATDEVWLVEDLGEKAGLLSGTSLPGEGYAIVAGHNHLNNAQSGPFLLIRDLRENDVIFVNTPDNELLRFSVYANELMDPDDMERLAGIAEQEENTLVLVTCENEAAEGGYLNRRVVFARPL